MRVLLQRVAWASAEVAGTIVGQIGEGFLLFVGVGRDDTEEDVQYLVEKVVNLRIFPDSEGRFSSSALDTRAELLIVSQFTLYADTRKGRRPSFTGAAPPERAEPLFQRFVERAQATTLKVATGHFQEHMLVDLRNDGPVTLMLDSADRHLSRSGSSKEPA